MTLWGFQGNAQIVYQAPLSWRCMNPKLSFQDRATVDISTQLFPDSSYCFPLCSLDFHPAHVHFGSQLRVREFVCKYWGSSTSTPFFMESSQFYLQPFWEPWTLILTFKPSQTAPFAWVYPPWSWALGSGQISVDLNKCVFFLSRYECSPAPACSWSLSSAFQWLENFVFWPDFIIVTGQRVSLLWDTLTLLEAGIGDAVKWWRKGSHTFLFQPSSSFSFFCHWSFHHWP